MYFAVLLFGPDLELYRFCEPGFNFLAILLDCSFVSFKIDYFMC
jgi:hypothetical protein